MASANHPLLFIVSEPVGSPIANDLSYRLTDQGVRTWIGSLAPAGELTEQALDALRSSAAVLLAFDAAAAQSSHVDRHLQVARQMCKPLIPLLIQPADEGLLRRELLNAQWIDGSAPDAAIAEITRRAFDYDRHHREQLGGAGAAAGFAGGAARSGQGTTRPRIQVVPSGPPAAAAAHPADRAAPVPEYAAARSAQAPRRKSWLSSPATWLAALALLAVIGAVLYNSFLAGGGDRQADPTVAENRGPVDYTVPEGRQDDAAALPPAEPAQPIAQPGSPAPLAAGQPGVQQPPVTATPGGVPEEVAAAQAPAASAAPVAATGAAATVQSFYSALSRGDGGTAAQHVVPGKRQSGPLSGAALTRYYSSFRRPLRIRNITPVDDDTVRVSYDYVLGDGRPCQGDATVNVAGGLVSSINTRGPC